MNTPRLHHQRRHDLQASARQNEARDMTLGQNVSSYQYLSGFRPRAQTNFQIRSTAQKKLQNVKNFEFHQNPVFPHTGITLEPVEDRKALRVTWESHLDYAAARIWRKMCNLGVETRPELMIFRFYI